MSQNRKYLEYVIVITTSNWCSGGTCTVQTTRTRNRLRVRFTLGIGIHISIRSGCRSLWVSPTCFGEHFVKRIIIYFKHCCLKYKHMGTSNFSNFIYFEQRFCETYERNECNQLKSLGVNYQTEINDYKILNQVRFITIIILIIS